MLQRLMPESDELIEQQETEIQKTIFKKKNKNLKPYSPISTIL